MAIQYSVSVRNAKLDAIETSISTAPLMALFSGSIPANTTTANSGTIIAQMTLPTNWLADANDGVISKSGTWQDTSADNSGTIGYFRIYSANGLCQMQGNCANSGADMNFDNNVVTAGQQITINTFDITAGNA